MSRVAIVAAMEREVRGLIKDWRVIDKEYGGRNFRFYENDDAVIVCGGIGPEAARRAAEAVMASFAPKIVYSAGFAGALNASLKVGDIVRPARVVNARDGSSVSLEDGHGILVSFESVASPAQKAKLRESFGGLAVDMEAAAVARATEARGTAFAAIKVISDDAEFDFPSTEKFVNTEGKFSEARFAWFAALRPWLWIRVFRLARNSNHASRVLSAELRGLPKAKS